MNNDGLEIERKFLIRMPTEQLLSSASRTDIVQTYLKNDEKGCTERVRKRGMGDNWHYTHNVKRRISDLRREEREREITKDQYEALLHRADGSRSVINKTRYCLEHAGALLEIDVYPFWSDRAVLEIELDDEQQHICLPSSIELLREISHDRRYTNAALALSVPYDEL